MKIIEFFLMEHPLAAETTRVANGTERIRKRLNAQKGQDLAPPHDSCSAQPEETHHLITLGNVQAKTTATNMTEMEPTPKEASVMLNKVCSKN